MLSPLHGHKAVAGGMDDRAAIFLSESPLSEGSMDPLSQTTRLAVNSEIPFEFENEYFSGSIVIIHRLPDDFKGDYHYRDFFNGKKRRWELRWQGKFKQPVTTQIVFGAEVLASRVPKRNFASRALLSILLKFSGSLARNRGADVFTNAVDDPDSQSDVEIKYFHFPIHSSDLILSTPAGGTPPNIASPSVLQPDETHTDCKSVFKTCEDIDISRTYTFVFYSMYADFISWDVCNVPIGLNGMSLNRLVGNQPVSVVMRSRLGSPEEYFRVLIANRCSSPDWSSFLTMGEKFNPERMSEFFSIVSWHSNEDAFTSTAKRRSSLPGKRRRFMGRLRTLLASCFRAPISFVMRRSTSSATTPRSRRKTSGTTPLPDSRRVEFVTPISEESEPPVVDKTT